MISKRVTIKDVAVEADVTAQTVSRVFNGKGYVSAETREKVLDAAKRLNYVPNRAAISLRKGYTKNIAVVFDSLTNVYFSIMVDYIHREVQKYGYTLQTVFTDSHTITEEIYRGALSMGAMAVISFLEADEALGEVVKKFEVPLLIFGRRAYLEEFDYITTDDVQGGRLVAERLLAAGCKTFAFAASGFGMTCVADRLEGFNGVLERHGYKAAVIDCSAGTESALLKYAEENGLPDGIFCFSDMIAYEILNSLKAFENHNTKVVGYDNIQSDISMPGNLTSVGVNKREYITFVVQLICAKIEGRLTGRIARKVDVNLYIGETA